MDVYAVLCKVDNDHQNSFNCLETDLWRFNNSKGDYNKSIGALSLHNAGESITTSRPLKPVAM